MKSQVVKKRKHAVRGWARKLGGGFARSPYDDDIRVERTLPVRADGTPPLGKWVEVEVKEI